MVALSRMATSVPRGGGGYALAAASDSDDSSDEAAREAQADEFAQAREDERNAITAALIRGALTALLLDVTDAYACGGREGRDGGVFVG